jgi:hypothetical protein
MAQRFWPRTFSNGGLVASHVMHRRRHDWSSVSSPSLYVRFLQIKIELLCTYHSVRGENKRQFLKSSNYVFR